MDYICFASGSSGNCALLRGGGVNLLIDAGISMKRIRQNLRSLGLDLPELDGVLVTHEHSDHVSALPMLAKYTDLPFFLSAGTAEALLREGRCPEKNLRSLPPELSLSLGELRVLGVPLLHDAAQPRAARKTASVSLPRSVSTATALFSPSMRQPRGCRFAVVECNHDVELLRRGPYPPALQRRILGDRGHLSNEAGAELALYLAENGAEEVLLGHLSRENNRPELALAAVRRRTGESLRLSTAARDACGPRIRVE